MELIYKQKFTDDQMQLLTLTDETRSIDWQLYFVRPCKRAIKNNKYPCKCSKYYVFIYSWFHSHFMFTSGLFILYACRTIPCVSKDIVTFMSSVNLKLY